MKINAKTLDDEACLWTRDLILKAYGFDITRLNKRVVKKSILEQLDLKIEQLEAFERIYNERGEDVIFSYLMNQDKKLAWTYYYLTEKEKEFFFEENKEDIDISFRLYAIGKLPPLKKKFVLNFYNEFWEKYFSTLPLLNNYQDDDLLNNHRDNWYIGQYNRSKIDSYFYIDTHNMFGVKNFGKEENYFILNPHSPNFLYLNFERIQDTIYSHLRKIVDKFYPEHLNIILRIYYNERYNGEEISKINFHNIQSSDRKQKMINVTFDSEKIEKLKKDILSGKKIYLPSKKDLEEKILISNLKAIQLKSFDEIYNEWAKAADNIHDLKSPENRIEKIFNHIIDENNTRILYKYPYYNKEINNKRIYIELNELQINKIYYPFDFEIAIEVYFDKKQREDFNNLTLGELDYKDIALNLKTSDTLYDSKESKTILPQFTFGKLHFSCLIDLLEKPDEFGFFSQFYTTCYRKDSNMRQEELINNYHNYMAKEILKKSHKDK